MILKYKPRALDLLKIHMYEVYTSLVGMVNIIFSISMLGLLITFWEEMSNLIRIILIILTLHFILIQPIILYFKYKNIVNEIDNISIELNENNFVVVNPNNSFEYSWNDLEVDKILNILIIKTDEKNGYILNLGEINEKSLNMTDFLKKRLRQENINEE